MTTQQTDGAEDNDVGDEADNGADRWVRYLFIHVLSLSLSLRISRARARAWFSTVNQAVMRGLIPAAAAAAAAAAVAAAAECIASEIINSFAAERER